MTEFAIADGHALADDDRPTGDEFATLALTAIVPSLTNPRTYFNEANLDELAESIRAQGVGQPILVRPLPANRLDETSRKSGRKQRETHEIISGERRYRASKLAGKTTIPVLIRKWDDVQVLTFQLVENLQRDDLSELEEAEGYQRLIDQAAMAKEVIGERIGKSRSYVYQRLKLLDLCTAGREALRAGKIDASKAQMIARIPDEKLQVKAVEEASRTDYKGDTVMSVKGLREWINRNVMLKLDGARFDIKDVTLREGAGPCGDCPKRTGANPDLFADADSPDLCTDPACFHDKEHTHDERVLEQAKAEGRKVIDPVKAAKIFQPYDAHQFKGYYTLDAFPHYSLGVDGKSVRKVLGKHCPPPVLVVSPQDGEVVEVLPVDQVKKVIATHGLGRKARSESKAAAKEGKLPIEERREFAIRYQAETIKQADSFFKHWTGVLPATLLRSFLADMFDRDESSFGPALDLGDEFDTGEALSRLHGMPDSAMPRVFIRWLLHDSEASYPGPWSNGAQTVTEPRHPTWEIFRMAGVDVAAIQAEVKREMESEERAAELEKEQKAAKAPKPKKSSAPPAAQALRAKGKAKTSEAQARGGISAALQAAEEEQDQAPDGAEQEEAAAPAAAPLSPLMAWPFPQPGASKAVPTPAPVPAASPVELGRVVRVKHATLAGIGAGYVGKKGVVKGEVIGAERWQVDFAGHSKVGRFPKIAEFFAEQLEVLS